MPDGWIEFRKNKHMEEFRADGQYIYRGADTSEISKDGVHPDGTFYVQYKAGTNVYGGAPWAPRSMKPETSFKRTCRVVKYDQYGKMLADYEETTTLHFVKRYTNWKNMGLDVVQLNWEGEETYYYARGYGLVKWQGPNGGSEINFDIIPQIQTAFPHGAVPRPETAVPGEISMPNPVYVPCPDRSTLGEPVSAVVTSLQANIANIRQECNTGSPILGVVKLNQKVTIRPKETEKLNGWHWYALEAPIKGWVADVATFTTNPDEPWLVDLNVPYVSQQDAYSSLKRNDCGLASLLMLTRYWLHQYSGIVSMIPSVNDLVKYVPNPDDPANLAISFTNLVLLSRNMGFPTIFRQPFTPDHIVEQLDLGKPSMVLVRYDKFNPSDAFDGAHLAVAIGYSQNYFKFHDPYNGGANYRISRTSLDSAMKSVPGNSLNYQGLYLG
jgi:hypothetical protein